MLHFIVKIMSLYSYLGVRFDPEGCLGPQRSRGWPAVEAVEAMTKAEAL